MKNPLRTQVIRKSVIGAAAACAAATMVVPLAASAASAGDDLRPRLERACLRIPNLEIRTQNVLTRLGGDSSVRGSLAWLQAQIDEASANGRNQLVEVLENRLEVRIQTVEVLRERTDTLATLRERCIEIGVEL